MLDIMRCLKSDKKRQICVIRVYTLQNFLVFFNIMLKFNIGPVCDKVADSQSNVETQLSAHASVMR